MILEIIGIFVILVLIAAVVLCIKIIKANLQKISLYEEWTVNMSDRCKQLYINMKKIDDRNLFERDDDVGTTFSDLLALVKKFDEKIEYVEYDEEDNQL
jgi:hypothetical protein